VHAIYSSVVEYFDKIYGYDKLKFVAVAGDTFWIELREDRSKRDPQNVLFVVVSILRIRKYKWHTSSILFEKSINTISIKDILEVLATK